jgi:hypothetical protein
MWIFGMSFAILILQHEIEIGKISEHWRSSVTNKLFIST